MNETKRLQGWQMHLYLVREKWYNFNSLIWKYDYELNEILEKENATQEAIEYFN